MNRTAGQNYKVNALYNMQDEYLQYLQKEKAASDNQRLVAWING